jgi:hypothetical protein
LDGTLTGLAIVVSVVAQATTLVVMHRTLNRQAERADLDHARRVQNEQHDRIRRAYSDLLRAGKFVDQAFRDLMFYPKGHPYPGTINAAQTPPNFDRYEFVNGCVEKAQSLVRDATVTIVLDHDADEVLRTWAQRVEQPFMNFYVACATDGLQKDSQARWKELTDGLEELAKQARAHFAKATPRT